MDKNEIRRALEIASEELLGGRQPGPLTGVRLVELAGVKRHRLTHDNPDINENFQQRSREINRTKPEVDRLLSQIETLRSQLKEVRQSHNHASQLLKEYASTILELSEQRDHLREALNNANKVTTIRPATRR